jgi:glucose/arabinose dehydrogenase
MNHRSRGARRCTPSSLARPLGFESLERRELLAATTINVHAAGSTGAESFQLQIDGVAVANWTATRVYNAANRQFDTFAYTHPTDVAINRIRVAFTNDGLNNGVDRNLWVDGVTVNNAKFESEATSVFSSGTYSSTTGGRLPGFRQTETLHYNGYLEYGAAASTIQVRAAGATGQEQMQLLIGGRVVATYNNVGGNYNNRTFVTFTYNHNAAIPLNQVRVAFTNDGLTSTGQDKNLRVDAVVLDGITHQTEAPTTFTTGHAIAGQGRQIGRFSSEILYYNGYMQYGAPGSVIDVKAAGRSGEERVELQIAGQTVASWTNVAGNFTSGQFQNFSYVHPTTVPLSQIRVVFVNDGTAAGGVARDVRVDGLELDGVMRQAEAADVFTTGFWTTGIGQAHGLWQSEYLYVAGYLQFASNAVPGTLALGTTLISVNENAGTVSIPVTRTGGSDGTVAVRYTLVNGTATAGSDYIGATGQLLVFNPGETSKSIVVPLTNDSLSEGNETFNAAIDLSLGGATTGVPRTATVTILDDEAPPPVGNGNGLLGVYYNNADLTAPVLSRTDATVNFNWGTGAPSTSLAADTFSVRWTGKVEPRFSETFTFQTTTDDGVRLWVNGQLLIDQWNDQGTTSHTGSLTLVAGQRYDIVMEYYENTGSAAAALAWSSSSQALQIIPQSQLYSDPPGPSEAGTFNGQTVASGLSQPVAIDFDDNGRMFIAEQRGVVRVIQNGAMLATPFLDIQSQVNFIQDRGLLGIAVHPNFPATPYIYVSYTYDPAETLTRTGNAGPNGGGNRVSRVTRFTADAATNFNTAVAGSEVVIVGTNSTWANISSPHLDSTDDMSLPPSGGQNGTLRDILIADSRSHTVGNLGFGPDGMLYIANGDGTSYGQTDARTVRVQNIDSLSGKILRVDPITGQGLADNPFYNGDPDANRSKVVNLGLRNPFRFAFQPGSGELFIGDVGWTQWEEINRGRGENFGWPFYEGGSGVSLQTGGYSSLAEAQAFYASNPDVQASLWARSHSAGGTAIVAGDFYTGTQFPDSYRNALFISDIGDNQIRVLRLNTDGSLNSVTPLGLNAGFVVEMSMGPDGALYYVDIANGLVGRLVYTPPAPALMAPAVGDFDDNGVVDGNDFLAWQRGLSPGGALSSLDRDAWRSSFTAGQTITVGAKPTEPSLAEELGSSPLLAENNSTATDDEPLAAIEPPLVNVVPVYAAPADGAEGEVTGISWNGGASDDEGGEFDAAFAVFGDAAFAWIDEL